MLKGIRKYLLISFGTVLFTVQAHAARILDNNPIKEDWKCKVVDGQWSCQRAEKPKNVFNKELKAAQKEKALADDLSWVNKPDYFVGGYYSNDSQFTKALCKSKRTDISYENAEYDTDGTLIASGNVEVLQCDQELYGNNAIVNFNADKSSIKSLVMTGDVIARQPSTGIVLRTKELDTNVNDGTLSAGETFFRMARETPNTRIYNKENFSGYLRGYATTFKKEDPNNLLLTDGYITSGGPYDNAWKITGKNIDIDTKEEMVYVKNGFFKVEDVPVMYLPYFSHPIGDKRRSGFLMPSFTQNDNAGVGFSVPYYFNLAPNYDLLLNTVYWTQRGIMENGTFRYMSKYTKNQFEGSIVPYDFQDKEMRGAFTLSSIGDYENGITTNLKYEYVSDSQYYNDFSAGNVNLVTKTLLDREFDINYNNDYIDSGVTVLDYGVVNPEIDLANIPYAKLPEVKFNLTSKNYTPDYYTLSLDTLNTYFYKSPYPVLGEGTPTGTNVSGFRSVEVPKIAGKFEGSWWNIDPSLALPIRYYQLGRRNSDVVKFDQSSVTSALPIFNIDASAYFDKDFTSNNTAYTTTLRPRLFYTYIPYQNQRNIPLFDTSQQNEQYLQMFQVNRFTGWDRINNANQLTYALEASTTNKADGSTLASAKIGQIAYFADRRVSLCQGNTNCDPAVLDPYANDSFSPIMSSFEFQIVKNIYLSAQINYRLQTQKFDYQVYQLSYKDANENIFNVSFNNIDRNWNAITQQNINDGVPPPAQETITLSTILNITNHWGITGLWNYDFKANQIANVFAGFQYNAKSWDIRALWQGTAYTSDNPNDPQALGQLTNTYVLEFELKGIGGAGASNLATRLNQINGYQSGEWGQGT
ncbi:LPS assembly protein LptD [Francisella sp. 19X1-34]|uniref:LPS-assembly protein LptD n=1 Tax=Francisella sp. 19X1-34 TaxID=3087177 RepID=UPI002E35B665|nr:LPS assembly protein LptD [Francisella sp. 19X1-34]MED7789190.1 LPS assembly protein LptD [Francisella sp. 19X1-34]